MQFHPEVESEAMRIGRRMVKDAIIAQGLKVSMINPEDITKAARVLIRHPDCKEIIETAWGIYKMRYEATRK